MMKDTSISFRLIKRMIVVPVYVNHLGPFKFILDIGAGASLITKILATKLGLKVLQKARGVGVGGKVTVEKARVSHLRLGETELENFPVYIADMSALSKHGGLKVDGIIGFDLLRRFEVTISYREKQLRLRPEK